MEQRHEQSHQQQQQQGLIMQEEIIESEDNGNEEFIDEDNGITTTAGMAGTSALRRRKGKIMSCAKETIENASRLIRRRVPAAGHLMTPRRLWLNKIPTQCDVVIEFPEDAPDDVLRWLLGRIRGPLPENLGLSTHVRAHESTKRTAFYISAPNSILYKAAEEARLPKRLRSDLGGALKEFTKRESHCFAQTKDAEGNSTLFTSQERQWLVLQVLQGLRACTEDLNILQGRANVEEGQSIVAAWQDSGLICQIFPLHETSALTQLQQSWVRKMFAPQPLDDIAEYFGVKVALYFAWLGHYTCALCVPAVLGTILWAGLWGRGQTAQDIGHILFSLFNVTWASVYLEAWRRYSVELSFRWGTLSTPPELLEPPRPLYKGPLEESPVTGRLEPREAPVWQRRAFRYLVSFPIIGLCLMAVFVVMFLMLRLQDWWDEKLPETGIISCLSVIPKVLLAGAITLMDEAYYKLAVWLNDKENYRLQSKYENHLIAKVALFQFVNSFLSLFYIAFYLRDEEKLKEQLAGLLISRQIIGNLRESAWPYIMEQWKLATLSFKMWGALSPSQEKPGIGVTINDNNDKKNESPEKTAPVVVDTTSSQQTPKRSIGQAEIESSLYKYDGTFSDHLEMLVQMGYVVLFSSSFPLAGLCALANNILEIRSDAFKLAHVHQRPFGQRVANIGTWQNALGMLGLAAVIVNCALIGMSGQVSRLWPGLTSTQTVILIVTLEHIMLGLRSALTWILPELPSWLAVEIARAENCRREMQCKGPSPKASPPSPPSSTSVSHGQSTPDHIDRNDVFLESTQHRIEPIPRKASNPMGYHPRDPMSQEREPRRSVDTDMSRSVTRELTPDSPVSQTSTVCLKQESPTQKAQGSGPSLQQQLSQDASPHSGSQSSSSSKTGSQPMQIPEIPPFVKKAHQQSTMSLVSHIPSQFQQVRHSDVATSSSTAPTKIPEIPPYDPSVPKRSKDWTPLPIDTEHHLTIGPSGGAEWIRRMKANEPVTLHKSTECIVAKEQTTESDPELHVRPVPSILNLVKPEDIASTSAPAASATTPKALTEEEQKAAEIAAKKSRLKQKLVKSARSVAIFSLKLKERRAREAERLAQETADVLTAPAGCGELDAIPIEKLLQVSDVMNARNQQGSGI